MNIYISTDKQKLDINFIHQFLTKAYWAKGRTREEVVISIENSLNFGLYMDKKQIGFARVLTDYTVFAYLMDVFVSDEYRGKGYAKKLMNEIIAHPDLQSVKRWMLATSDAHGLYEQFGFAPIPDPSKIMGKLIQ